MNTQLNWKRNDHWSGLGSEFLDSYLIQSFENPSINPQSVLMRSFLVDHLFPNRFNETINQEIYYSACACYALLANQEGWFRELYNIVQSEIHHPNIPKFLQPDFIYQKSRRFSVKSLFNEIGKCLTVGFEHIDSPFRKIWLSHLKRHFKCGAKVLELGCGSANDYRYWSSYGIASFINYTGMDISPINIRNARKRHPHENFRTADACNTGYADESFDIVVAFDLIEHLSPDKMQTVLAEASRISRNEIWISCFNAGTFPLHEFKADGTYYRNRLSVGEIAKQLAINNFKTEWISIKNEYTSLFPGYRQYNENAAIIVATKAAFNRNQTEHM